MFYVTFVTIMCRNDEFFWQWVELLTDAELFILFSENSQIILKSSVNPILLTFMYLVALTLLVNNQLNSLLNSTHRWTQLIIVAHNCHTCVSNVKHDSALLDASRLILINSPPTAY